MSFILDNLRYTATHEWVRKENDNHFVVGITDHAQSLLGDIVFVELPSLNRQTAVGSEVAVIESVKAAADVYCPLEGEIVAVNQYLAKAPELINTSPFEEGWIFKIRAKNPDAYTTLLDADNYKAQIIE